MKKFKYKFTKLTLSLIYAGIALCFAGLGINIFRIINDNIEEAANIIYPIIQYTLFFLIPVILLVLLISLLLASYYSIDENTLKTSFGIIKSKYDVKDIKSVILDRTTNKLSVGMSNGTLFMIVVNEEWYQDFINALCRTNPLIEYSINSKENNGDDKDEKKK